MSVTYPRLFDTARLQRLESGVCVRELWSSGEIIAQGSAGFLLSLCDGNMSSEQISKLIGMVYGVSEEEAGKFTDKTLKAFSGWIHFSDTPSELPSKYDVEDFAYKTISVGEDNQLSSPVAATLNLTNRCNFNCVYCFNDSGVNGEKGLTKDDWLSAIKQLSEMGVSKIEITGGEPFTVDGIDEILKAACDTDALTYIFTNGFLIDEKRVELLSSYKNLLPQISLDSAIPGVHHVLTDTSRTFDKVIWSISSLIKAGSNLRVKGLLLPDTYKDAGKLIDLLDSLGVPELTLDTYDLTYIGRGDFSWTLTPDMGKEVQEIIAKKRNLNIKVAFTPPKESFTWRCPEDRSRCGAGTKYMTLSPSGEYSLCDRTSGMPEFSIGKFPDMTIAELWASKKPIDMKNPPIEKYDEPCKSCPDLMDCRSGCFAAKRIVTDRPYGADPHCPKANYAKNPYKGR